MITKTTKVHALFVCVCCVLLAVSLKHTAGSESEGDKKNSIGFSKTALIIIDIQNDYFQGGKYELEGSAEASFHARKILNLFRTKGFPVIHIRHESKSKNSGFFVSNTDGQKIHRDVIPLPRETVITKQMVSSFAQTPLLEQLRKENIRRLIIVGMQTNVCVLGTVKDGLKKGFEIIVISDATAAKDMATHDKTLPLLESEGAKIMSTAAFIDSQ